MTAPLSMTTIYAAQDAAAREPLADMQARRRQFQDMADSFGFNNEPGLSRLHQDAADAISRDIAERERQGLLIDADRNDVPLSMDATPMPDMIGAFVARVWDAGWQAV